MFKLSILFLTAVFSLAAAAAPNGLLNGKTLPKSSDTLIEQTGEEYTERVQDVYTLAPGGQINLENYAGAINIVAWDRNEVEIIAVKRAYKKERIREVSVGIETLPKSVNIKTKYAYENLNWSSDKTGQMQNPASVSYTLSVPRSARLNINLHSGNAVIKGVAGNISAESVNANFSFSNISGNIKVSTVNGHLEAIVSPQDKQLFMLLSSVNGSLNLFIESQASLNFTANTLYGELSNDLGLRANNAVGSYLTGFSGSDGKNSVELRSVNGSITINRRQY